MLVDTHTPIDLTSLLASILALSMAVERVVEILKQTIGNFPLLNLLFTARQTSTAESWRCALLHIISALIGGLITANSEITIPGIKPPLLWMIAGLLSAGGSAFWNHALDFAKAAKVQKEQSAKLAVANTSQTPLVNAVNL